MFDLMDYHTASVAGVECFCFGVERQNAPVVFVTHGRGGAAVHLFDLCRRIADAGMIAVALDQRNHGRRLVDARANGGWSPHHAADMYGNVVGTALDVSLLIGMLPARLGISVERVGMTGISMGGHATLIAMALDSRIAVGAPIIGSGDYRRLMEFRAVENDCPPEEFPRYFSPALEEVVKKFDPIRHPERFADRPLLMLNGDADTLVPIDCNRGLLAACRPFYTNPERLQLHEYPDIGHAATPEMQQEAVSWLQRWLAATP